MTIKQELWEQKLKDGLDKLDSWYPPKVTEPQIWEETIINERRKQKRRLIRELGFLWLFAGVMIGVSILTFAQLPLLFVYGQMVLLIGFPLFGWLKWRQNVISP